MYIHAYILNYIKFKIKVKIKTFRDREMGRWKKKKILYNIIFKRYIYFEVMFVRDVITIMN